MLELCAAFIQDLHHLVFKAFANHSSTSLKCHLKSYKRLRAPQITWEHLLLENDGDRNLGRLRIKEM